MPGPTQGPARGRWSRMADEARDAGRRGESCKASASRSQARRRGSSGPGRALSRSLRGSRCGRGWRYERRAHRRRPRSPEPWPRRRPYREDRQSPLAKARRATVLVPDGRIGRCTGCCSTTSTTTSSGGWRDQHLALARQAHDRGELALAGALSDPVDHSVLVLLVPEASVAEDFARNDPYVKEGLVTAWRIRSWRVVIGNETDRSREAPHASTSPATARLTMACSSMSGHRTSSVSTRRATRS